MHRNAVNAVADFSGRVGHEFGSQASVDRSPRLAGVIRSENTRGRDGRKDPFRIARIHNDRMQAHSARTGLPGLAGVVASQSGKLLPSLALVGRAKDRGVTSRLGMRRLF